MLNNKKICLLVVLIILSTILIVTGASLNIASTTKNLSLKSVESTANSIKHFSDVSEKDWFFSDVQYVSNKKIMNGTSDTTFEPNVPTTRGMIVTILWRLDGEPKVSSKKSFSDVKDNAYYYQAVTWAAENKIVSGYNDTYFGPEDFINREQLAAIFYRYIAFKDFDVSCSTDISQFEDVDQIDDYAIDAMNWAYAKKIIAGTASNTISPKGNAARCQVAAILKRVCEKILDTKDTNDFGDKVFDNKEDSAKTNKPSSDLSEDTSSSGYVPPSDAGGDSETDDSDNIYEEIVKEQPVIKVNTAYGKPGDVAEVTLDLQKNSGILGMILSLEYDETSMRLLSAENGAAVSDVLTLTPSNTLNSGVRFVWDGLEVSSTDIKNGTLLTLKFEILDSVTIGKRYPLKINYNPGDIVDTDLNEVNPRIYQGYIEIEEY